MMKIASLVFRSLNPRLNLVFLENRPFNLMIAEPQEIRITNHPKTKMYHILATEIHKCT
jgi:hypothetical protein